MNENKVDNVCMEHRAVGRKEEKSKDKKWIKTMEVNNTKAR